MLTHIERAKGSVTLVVTLIGEVLPDYACPAARLKSTQSRNAAKPRTVVFNSTLNILHGTSVLWR
jgi:hypothetical protein